MSEKGYIFASSFVRFDESIINRSKKQKKEKTKNKILNKKQKNWRKTNDPQDGAYHMVARFLTALIRLISGFVRLLGFAIR